MTPCLGRLVQEGNCPHYLCRPRRYQRPVQRRGCVPSGPAFPLLMKQLELMLTSGELNPRHQHTVTLYAKGLTCKADTLGSCGYVYSGCLSDAPKRKVNHRNNLLLRHGVFTTPLFHFSSLHIRKIFSMKTLPDTHIREGIALPVSRHHLADTALPTAGPALRPYTE